MEFAYLSSTVVIKTISEDATHGVFEMEGLYAGYGLTVGNALRRVLLSSLPGAAVTEIKIKNAPHEFSTLPGLKEDLVALSLNFKNLRFRIHTDEPQVLMLYAKGPKTVTAGDIETNAQVEILNPDFILGTLTTKDAELSIEVTVERGLGYSPVESRKSGRLAVGTVAIDAMFTPVTNVNYTTEDMRVGDRTDYNLLRIEIETDGSVSPSSALHKAATILKDHFEKIAGVAVVEPIAGAPIATGEVKKKGRPRKVKDLAQESEQ